eukprot:GILJ01001025.1.p1 GENE.GILJ01001025.1~~GILJ01001025.1.p1  ORF type:complete len:808 (+),score=168.15 GILJ01001025.1:71-2494(+)
MAGAGAVIGIDFGTDNSVIAVVRRGGVETIVNDVSNRSTPSMVSFGEKERYLGEQAKTKVQSNFKNSVVACKRFLGRSFNDPSLPQELRWQTCKTVDLGGKVGFEVNYQGESRVFNIERIVGMFLDKLKLTAEAEGSPVVDCCISVPVYFPDAARIALLDAAKIAGLNCLRIINENTATALAYGIYRSSEFSDTEPSNVAFVDMGHSQFTVSVVSFNKGRLQVRSTASDMHLGGRDLDWILMEHFAQIFKKKYGSDPLAAVKPRLRLSEACNKTKTILSANHDSPISVECLIEDHDLSALISRDEFEALCTEFAARINKTISEAVNNSGLTLEQIHTVEIVGGSTRVPFVQTAIKNSFQKELSRTMNASECVARGCALQAAMLSPLFKVREFAVNDAVSFPISLAWSGSQQEHSMDSMDVDEENKEPTVNTSGKSAILFQQFSPFPATKMLTFYRSEPFDLLAQYEQVTSLPAGTPLHIGKYRVNVPAKDGSALKIKVRVRVNIHGVVSVEGAELLEEYEEIEQPAPAAPAEAKADSTDPAKPEEPKVDSEPKVKRKVKRTELNVTTLAAFGLTQKDIQTAFEEELQMLNDDRVAAETAERKNALESYIYEARARLNEQLSEFSTQQEKDNISQRLEAMENWLYDDGLDAIKSVYVAKLEELKNLGDPLEFRYKESQMRAEASRSLETTIAQFSNQAESTDEKYAHIDQAEKNKVIEECKKASRWLYDKLSAQDAVPKTSNPVVTSSEIKQKRDELNRFATPILTKPKPAPPKVDAAPKAEPHLDEPALADGHASADASAPKDMDLD